MVVALQQMGGDARSCHRLLFIELNSGFEVLRCAPVWKGNDGLWRVGLEPTEQWPSVLSVFIGIEIIGIERYCNHHVGLG